MKDYTKQTPEATQDSTVGFDAGLRSYMVGVYKNMGLALFISGLCAYFAGTSEAYITTVFSNKILYWGIALSPLALVIFLGVKINSLKYGTAKIVFLVFSVLMGLSLASIFMIYTEASIFKMFLVTSGTFAGMSLYGYTTKRDLTGFGSFLIMGVIGIFIAMIVNYFLQSSILEFAISVIGVFIFIGLTAYDTQRIKNMYFQLAGQGEALKKAALMGALSLYLDFINLMIMMLRLFGERR